MRLSVYTFFFSLMVLLNQQAIAQTAFSKTSFLTISEAPMNIAASDGTYAKYVLVRWMSPGSAKSFQIFRSPDEQVSNATLLNQKNIESSWLLDYDVKPGVKYHYWVKAAYEASDVSPFSTSDDGFAAILENIAIDDENLDASIENLAVNDPERFIPNPFLEPMINDTRGNELNIEMTAPAADQELKPAHDLMIEFTGNIQTDQLPDEKLLLHIYSNDKAVFIDDITLVKTVLEITQSTNGEETFFTVQVPFPYSAGLYYYSIQLEDAEEPIKIGKLLLK